MKDGEGEEKISCLKKKKVSKGFSETEEEAEFRRLKSESKR